MHVCKHVCKLLHTDRSFELACGQQVEDGGGRSRTEDGQQVEDGGGQQVEDGGQQVEDSNGTEGRPGRISRSNSIKGPFSWC